MKLIHTSDWQIGMRGSGLGTAGELVSKQRIQTISKILDIAERENADCILLAGDTFENNSVSVALVEDVVRLLRARPSIELHAIPGNHDLPGPGSIWNRSMLQETPNLHIHTEAEPIPLLDGAVVLHPFPVKSRYSGTDPLAQLEDLHDSPGIHIGIAHGALTTITFGAHEDDIRLPIDPAHVSRTGLDYLALGHWHGTRLVEIGSDPVRIAYSGTHEQTRYEETDAGNILIVEIAEKGAVPTIRKERCGHLSWTRESISFQEDVNLDRLANILNAPQVDLLRLSVEGELPQSLHSEYQAMLEAARLNLKDLRMDENELKWVHTGAFDGSGITDAALQRVRQDLLDRLQTEDGEEREIALAALALFDRQVREVLL